LLSIASASLQNIGEVLVAQGDLTGAADALRQSLALRRRLYEIDRNCEQRRRDVDRSIERLGDVLILKSTVSGFSSDRRANSASNGRSADEGLARLKAIGDALEARGDLAGALALFREYLETQRKRIARKPEDAASLRDLSWTLGAVGRVHKAQGDLSAALAALSEALDVRRALAARSPAPSARQLDLSFSLMAVGEVLEARADPLGALSAYQEAAEVRRQLCAVNPSSNGLRCDLAASLIRIGESLERNADRVGALDSYREALEVARQLSAREPESSQWKEDLWQLQGRIDAIMRGS
jgi:tetratricopeptide (TPR) repeat protein